MPRGWGTQVRELEVGRGPGAALPHPGGRAGGAWSRCPEALGRSPLPRPAAAAQQPVPPARLATEPSFGRGTPALWSPPGSCPTPLSAPLQPAPGLGAHATQGASDLGSAGLLPRVGSDATSLRVRANRLGSQFWTRVRKSVLLVWDESVLTASLCCARGLPPVPVSPFLLSRRGKKKSRAPFSLKHEKQMLVVD